MRKQLTEDEVEAFRARGEGPQQIDPELRILIRRMSMENPFWRAPRIHGELFKLGFEAAHSSVAKYMGRRRGSPSQDGKHFCAIRRRTSLPWTCLLSRFDGNASTMLLCSANGIFIRYCSRMNHYNETRTHLYLDKDSSVSRAVDRAGHSLPLNPRWIASSIYSDLIYDRHTRFIGRLKVSSSSGKVCLEGTFNPQIAKVKWLFSRETDE